MCKRLIINAGIERVVMQSGNDDFVVVKTEEWIENDDSLCGF